MSKRRLDDLLRTWAARHALSEAQAHDLATRIHDWLSRQQARAPEASTNDRCPRRVPAWLAWAVAAAAALLAATAVLRLSRNGRPGAPDPPRLASISKAEVERSTHLFRELETLFDDDLRSAVESGTDVRLSVAPLAGGRASDAVPLLARLTVAFRKRGDRAWRKPLEADILCRTEEVVEAVPDPTQANRVVFWACSLPDGKVAVDVRLRLSMPLAASADLTAVLTPGKPKQLLALETGEGECRVLLIVVPLPGRQGVPCSDT